MKASNLMTFGYANTGLQDQSVLEKQAELVGSGKIRFLKQRNKAKNTDGYKAT